MRAIKRGAPWGNSAALRQKALRGVRERARPPVNPRAISPAGLDFVRPYLVYKTLLPVCDHLN